jgi:uncharacterized membrane protein HdeD (DUF308 family)
MSLFKTETLWTWAKYVLFGVFSAYFIFWGIVTLISSYSMSDPFNFIMTFFSSNLIILIGLVPVVGLCFKIYEWLKKSKGVRDGHRESVHRTED